ALRDGSASWPNLPAAVESIFQRSAYDWDGTSRNGRAGTPRALGVRPVGREQLWCTGLARTEAPLAPRHPSGRSRRVVAEASSAACTFIFSERFVVFLIYFGIFRCSRLFPGWHTVFDNMRTEPGFS